MPGVFDEADGSVGALLFWHSCPMAVNAGVTPVSTVRFTVAMESHPVKILVSFTLYVPAVAYEFPFQLYGN